MIAFLCVSGRLTHRAFSSSVARQSPPNFLSQIAELIEIPSWVAALEERVKKLEERLSDQDQEIAEVQRLVYQKYPHKVDFSALESAPRSDSVY